MKDMFAYFLSFLPALPTDPYVLAGIALAGLIVIWLVYRAIRRTFRTRVNDEMIFVDNTPQQENL